MQPCGVRIWTDRLEESRDFYTGILPFQVKIDGSESGWIIIGTESIDLILEMDEGEWVGRFTALSFFVEDIHAVADELREKKVEIVSGPIEQEWGGWLCDFKDNVGNTLTLVQNPD